MLRTPFTVNGGRSTQNNGPLFEKKKTIAAPHTVAQPSLLDSLN